MKMLARFLEEELEIDSEKFMHKFIQYEKLLLEWNEKINLVSRKKKSIEDQLLNSVFFLTKFHFKGSERIADIGTGGGFPGIPIGILFPEVRVLLVDSIRKKVNAVRDILGRMHLGNAEAVCGRAESVSAEKKFAHRYDYVVSKAVDELPRLCEWGHLFLRPGGKLLCIKGGNISDEIAALREFVPSARVQSLEFNMPEYGIEYKKLIVITPAKR